MTYEIPIRSHPRDAIWAEQIRLISEAIERGQVAEVEHMRIGVGEPSWTNPSPQPRRRLRDLLRRR